jgi:glycosyltransferase involved in cell wall biosynthesis
MTDILIDATSLDDASAFRGIGTYVRRLLAGLAPDERFSVSALVTERTEVPASVEPVRVRRLAPPRFRPNEHDLRLPYEIRRARPEVFHSPALDPPRRASAPWVSTLHDVIPLVLDHPDLAAERRRWQRRAPRYRSAAAVIAVSRYTADEGIRALGLDPRRVEVIPHGVGEEFRPPAGPRASEEPYLLLVGEYSKRKGYGEAFAAAGALAEAGYPHRLHVVGRVAPWVRPRVEAVVSRAAHRERIDVLGYVDDLVAEYQRASILLMTSRYEGFGLPILEAMACGTPVVAFDNSSIPEVVGDAGVLVPDGDVEALVRATRSVLDDESRWHELSERGLERARGFGWDRSVAAHAELFSAVARAGDR